MNPAFAAESDTAMGRPFPRRYRGRKRRPAQARSVHQILMCAHRIPRSLGVLFAHNKTDLARRAASDDDAVLIPSEPEARDIGGRDRVAVDFVISRHDWPRWVLLEQHNKCHDQGGRDGHPHQQKPDK